MASIFSISHKIEFFYQSKWVTIALKPQAYIDQGYQLESHHNQREMLYFPFDSWFNCVDVEYLRFMEENEIYQGLI